MLKFVLAGTDSGFIDTLPDVSTDILAFLITSEFEFVSNGARCFVIVPTNEM